MWLTKPPGTTALGHKRRRTNLKIKPRALHRLPLGWPRPFPASDTPELSAFCCSTHSRFAMSFLQYFCPAAPGFGRIAATHSKLVMENQVVSEKQPQHCSRIESFCEHRFAAPWALLCRRILCSLRGAEASLGLVGRACAQQGMFLSQSLQEIIHEITSLLGAAGPNPS